MKRLRWECVVAVLILHGLTQNVEGQDPSAAADAAGQSRIALGKETSYIVKPLRADGYPDYVAAINKHQSLGVTPENNAAVLLVKSLGPGVISPETRAETLEKLGLAGLPESGDYLVSQRDMIKRWLSQHPSDKEDSLYDQFDAAQLRPWTSEEFPIVAQWLTINEKPLEIARNATERPKCFVPCVSYGNEYPPVISMLLDIPQSSRQVAFLLTARAMRRLAQNDVGGAWQDLMACHKLARLIAQGPCMIEGLVGCALEGIADEGDAALAHFGKLTARQALQMQGKLRELPPVVDFAAEIDIGERSSYLDCVVFVTVANRFAAVEKIINLIVSMGPGGGAKKPNAGHADAALDGVDFNVPMRMGNEWYNRLVKYGRIADVRERRKALAQFDADLKKLGVEAKQAMPSGFVPFLASGKSKEEAGQVLGKLLCVLLTPGATAAFRAEERASLNGQMVQTAFALAAYRADHGQYPDQLAELVPAYIATAPDDTFSDQATPIKYRREGDAYLLWSVGFNGIDDNGRSYDDNPKGDDLVLRPVPKK